MSRLKTFLVLLLMSLFGFAQVEKTTCEILLLIRADDIGTFHPANVACIELYQNGIARSVDPKERSLT